MKLRTISLIVALLAGLSLSGCALFGSTEEFEEPSDPDDQTAFPDDAAALIADDCPAALHAAGLSADWTTPNTIRWSWDYAGTDEPLETFVLVVGTSETMVRERRTEAIYFGPEQARELSKVTGEHRREWSVAYGLEPDTEYFAQLVAVQPNDCTSGSNVASATTSLPENEFVIFSEDATEGYSIPDGVNLSNRVPYQGDFHYEWEASCDGEESCYEIVRRQDLGLKADIPEAAFGGALLEFAVLNEGSAVGQFEQVRFQFRVGGESALWSRNDFVTTAPSNDYRIVQVPLNQFFSGGAPMTWDDLTAGEIYEFGIGNTWSAGTMVSFDEVRIRY